MRRQDCCSGTHVVHDLGGGPLLAEADELQPREAARVQLHRKEERRHLVVRLMDKRTTQVSEGKGILESKYHPAAASRALIAPSALRISRQQARGADPDSPSTSRKPAGDARGQSCSFGNPGASRGRKACADGEEPPPNPTSRDGCKSKGSSSGNGDIGTVWCFPFIESLRSG